VIEYAPLGKPVNRQHATVRDGLDDTHRAACLAELGVAPL
jgi:hypothetical protein